MNYKKDSERINKLKSIAKFEKRTFLSDLPLPHREFIGVVPVLYIGNEGIETYETEINALFKSHPEITESYTTETIEFRINLLISTLWVEQRDCTSEDFSKLIEEWLSVELKEFEVMSEVQGIELKHSQLKLGDFTIYNFSKSYKELTKIYSLLEKSIYADFIKSSYVISIKIKAREYKKANEKAHKYFSRVENVANYMLGDLSNHRQFRIFNYRDTSTIATVICHKNELSATFKKFETYLPIKLEDAVFTDPVQGNDAIWLLITKQDKTEIEKRILNSIDWIGKALIEQDKPRALVQFVFAIECMLQYDDGQIISPSITSQIADWLAFIINDDLEERKKISNYFKHIYRKRSKVAHGGKEIINEDELYLAYILAKQMIRAFLGHPPLKSCRTIKQVSEFMIDQKFK